MYEMKYFFVLFMWSFICTCITVYLTFPENMKDSKVKETLKIIIFIFYVWIYVNFM